MPKMLVTGEFTARCKRLTPTGLRHCHIPHCENNTLCGLLTHSTELRPFRGVILKLVARLITYRTRIIKSVSYNFQCTKQLRVHAVMERVLACLFTKAICGIILKRMKLSLEFLLTRTIKDYTGTNNNHNNYDNDHLKSVIITSHYAI